MFNILKKMPKGRGLEGRVLGPGDLEELNCSQAVSLLVECKLHGGPLCALSHWWTGAGVHMTSVHPGNQNPGSEGTQCQIDREGAWVSPGIPDGPASCPHKNLILPFICSSNLSRGQVTKQDTS